MKLTISLELYITTPTWFLFRPKRTCGSKSPTHLDRWSFQSVKRPIAFWRGWWLHTVVFFSDIQILNDELSNQILISTNTATFKNISYIYIYTLYCMLSITYVLQYFTFMTFDVDVWSFWLLVAIRCNLVTWHWELTRKKGHTPDEAAKN